MAVLLPSLRQRGAGRGCPSHEVRGQKANSGESTLKGGEREGSQRAGEGHESMALHSWGGKECHLVLLKIAPVSLAGKSQFAGGPSSSPFCRWLYQGRWSAAHWSVSLAKDLQAAPSSRGEAARCNSSSGSFHIGRWVRASAQQPTSLGSQPPALLTLWGLHSHP